LPELNNNLLSLYCNDNKLTQLPELNNELCDLSCEKNQLTKLPELNRLTEINCSNNQLTELPKLNNDLNEIDCQNNYLPCKLNIRARNINVETRNDLNYKIQCLKRFKEFYYLLKFKTQFRDWLWIKVRLPRIQNKFHPDNLDEFLCTVNEEDMDEKLNNW
jgi:hypothetical protein